MNKKVWGHRGCRGAGYPPENSLAAFQTAIDAGVGGIELDIFLSQDGIPFVFHDDTLQRMTGQPGSLSSHSFQELKKLRLRSVEGRPTKELIPTLAEVLDLINSRALVLNIELKDPNSVVPVAELITLRLAKGWSAEQFLVSSFDMACLRHFKSVLPSVPLGTLFDAAPVDLPALISATADLQPATINIPAASLTPAVQQIITAAGATPVVWTPDEISPAQLPQQTREKLLQDLRERSFIFITDFPKELLALLKPSKTRATVTGVLAACLAFTQQDMLFRPTESGLESIKPPSQYPELERFGFRETSLTAADGVTSLVWERPGALDRPHYLLFHGNRAHWGDTGAGDNGRDRRARLKFLSTLASSGAGVTAVTLRGFGNSSAIPSESGFLLDLRAVADYLTTALSLHHQTLIVAGESLGTWAATQTAVYLTQRNTPPALLSLQNPFTSMAEVGAQFVSHFPIVRSFNIGLSASALDRHVLKSHFYTANLFRDISAGTIIHIATSGRDGLVHPSHSDRLAEIALGQHLHVVRDLFPEALHSTIPPTAYAQRLITLGIESCTRTSHATPLWGDTQKLSGLPDHLPYF